MITPKTGKLSLQRGRTLVEYEMKVPSKGMCSKPSRPKNSVVGLPYLSNEDYFPEIMRQIIREMIPVSNFLKEETSNDLLVHKLLKSSEFDLEKDSD